MHKMLPKKSFQRSVQLTKPSFDNDSTALQLNHQTLLAFHYIVLMPDQDAASFSKNGKSTFHCIHNFPTTKHYFVVEPDEGRTIMKEL